MLVTLFPNDTDVSAFIQKAPLPMLVTLFGITTDLRSLDSGPDRPSADVFWISRSLQGHTQFSQ